MTAAASTKPFAGVQPIVRRGGNWQHARHLVLNFREGASTLRFLNELLHKHGPTPTAGQSQQVQVSLGITRTGLQALKVPDHVLACMATKAPAFTAGAAVRAASHAGASGQSLPSGWDAHFAFHYADAVVTLHGQDRQSLIQQLREIRKLARRWKVAGHLLPKANRLPRPDDIPAAPDDNRAMWVHFGFRDGLARVGIHEWAEDTSFNSSLPTSRHHVGEFVLGYQQDSGANPWITGPDQRVWPQTLRDFFRDGSFGVLHQIQQNVGAFEAFVKRQASWLQVSPDHVKAKLCGRTPAGVALAAPSGAKPTDDFDYQADQHGHGCPFGSHVRRMNPRTDELAHAGRTRAVLRRGMPYGKPWQKPETPELNRGLIAHFFCASIEDQFEHLLGQWADRVPMGSADLGGARDPLIGAHDPRDGAFHIPRKDRPDLQLTGLQPFVRTRGTAYLFYPSLSTLQRIARNSLWLEPDEDDQ